MLEALSGNGHQLRYCGEIPVGVGDLGVAEVGRERKDLPVYLGAFLIPPQESANGERVAQIVDPRPPCAAMRGPAQTIAQPAEGLFNSGALKGEGTIGVEEELRWLSASGSVASGHVANEGLNCGWVERDKSRLAELALADREQALAEIHIVAVEATRFGEPQAARGQ